MSLLFLLCLAGVIAVLPPLFRSYEYERLRQKYGKERGNRIGEILGIVTGYLYFGLWAGLWLSPQERFSLGVLAAPPVTLSVWGVTLSIPLDHLLVGLAFVIPGAWLGIAGVREVTLRVAELHRPERVVTTGVYAHVRHPQYLGGVLSHVGISFVLSGLCSLLVTPVMIVVNFLIARKEETELLREFGKVYEIYKQQVPMLIPRLRAKS